MLMFWHILSKQYMFAMPKTFICTIYYRPQVKMIQIFCYLWLCQPNHNRANIGANIIKLVCQ